MDKSLKAFPLHFIALQSRYHSGVIALAIGEMTEPNRFHPHSQMVEDA
jgi:hypothetical protein